MTLPIFFWAGGRPGWSELLPIHIVENRFFDRFWFFRGITEFRSSDRHSIFCVELDDPRPCFSDHLERLSESSSVSKEVAAIYLNALHKQQRQHKEISPDAASVSKSIVWLPIPSNSEERRNFEQGLQRSPGSTLEKTKPLSVLTNFHVPPPPRHESSNEFCGDSICSTISLTATPTPSPSTTLNSFGSLSPRFPIDVHVDDSIKESIFNKVRKLNFVFGNLFLNNGWKLQY